MHVRTGALLLLTLVEIVLQTLEKLAASASVEIGIRMPVPIAYHQESKEHTT